ncbi:regulator of chromosome condensation 1/beta-lactamase-inhibitor protein II [Pterulicium gracile]|uniref:Regulator of chromosome condensation 1/beta-lactamase-inhibitor protein II n=1 Tax=Pterulicium gracile TaxID=1884261 RepID=A0A5C3QV54_9AGAR|nr:regulator of chromosome condensation 1/beta-lactamase-inhibitor protein II [Pterula gracilis]
MSAIPVERYIEVPTAFEASRPALNLFVWGAGNFGQFGAGPDDLGEKRKPKRNPWVDEKIREGVFGKEGAGFESVTAGGLHTLLVDENGAVWSCGVNDDAALGRKTSDVPDPADPTKMLDMDELTAWPHPIQSLVDENFRAVRVAAGDNISAAISAEGDLRVWGSFRGNEGQLGFSSGLAHQLEPIDILSAKLAHGEKVTAVAPGANHLVVLTTSGHIFTWGAGEQGQLGRRIIERRKINGTAPERILLGTKSLKAKLIGTGQYHSFAVDEDGDVWAWGLNSMGQTGTGRSRESDAEVPTPVIVKALMKKNLSKGDDEDEVVRIEGGEHHTLFLTRKGHVYACGRADGGQLGLGEEHAALEQYKDFVDEPTRVVIPDEEEDPIVLISVGSHNNLAVTRDGALFGWGQGPQGELGLGEEEEVFEPTVIVRRTGGAFKAVKVSCGGQHSVGLFQRKEAA